MDDKPTAREAQKEQYARQELVERLERALPRDGKIEPLKGLWLSRATAPSRSIHVVSQPSFCVIAQGCKEIFLADVRYQYDPYSYLLNTMDLPLVGRILAASEEQPYLAMRLIIEPALVGSVLLELSQLTVPRKANMRALSVSSLHAQLLETVVRLVRLLESPGEATVLAPLVTRELVYRLLVGEQGERLRQMTVLGGHSRRIAQAVERLRKEFDQPLSMERLARQTGLSVSGFHHHFKAATAMSPLQFQKQLRLQEARRLMLGEDLDAASAGYRVGYEDASHFSREYKRHFGRSPIRDVGHLREVAQAGADV